MFRPGVQLVSLLRSSITAQAKQCSKERYHLDCFNSLQPNNSNG